MGLVVDKQPSFPVAVWGQTRGHLFVEVAVEESSDQAYIVSSDYWCRCLGFAQDHLCVGSGAGNAHISRRKGQRKPRSYGCSERISIL